MPFSRPFSFSAHTLFAPILFPKAGHVYFYCDLSRWAPHLAPGADAFVDCTISGKQPKTKNIVPVSP